MSASATVSASARGANGSRRSTSPAASARAASTTSVDNAARCSAPLLMVRTLLGLDPGRRASPHLPERIGKVRLR